MNNHESLADYVEIAFPRPIAEVLRARPDRHSFVSQVVEAALPQPTNANDRQFDRSPKP